MVIVGVTGFERLTIAQPAGFRMLAIIGILLLCMKAVVAVESQASTKPPLRLLNWISFAGLWFGMRPTLFVLIPGPVRHRAADLIQQGVNRLAIGTVFVVVARLIWVTPDDWFNDFVRRSLSTIFLLPGISLILHFGVFNIVAGCWRRVGVNTRPMFRAPLLSKSLSEFWGQRWNLAFSEMTTISVFRPLRERIGPRLATMVAFLFSGLLHELAISVPVQAGFGLPLLYFALHAIAMFIEKHFEQTGRPIYRNAWSGRIWTTAWLVIPLPLLFHRPFLNGCVWPLIGIETG